MARVTIDDDTLEKVENAIQDLKRMGHKGLTVREVIRDAVRHFLTDLPDGYVEEIPSQASTEANP